ncbi:MAG: holo-[acyl-carrier protein] synthase [Candidatus Tokpelaia sp. JSC188]|nr:MAG: holo-[acyl-carrier protein] synthase [Candidatus Tokpelaia sp. JSC188]
MVIGIGNDIIDIRRVEKLLDQHGERFINRVFTQIERKKSETRKKRAASYAKRFAAKEACAKALGSGISNFVWWRDLGVINLPSGQPGMELTGYARLLADRLLPPGCKASIHLTIADDYPWAHALVVIEAVSLDNKAKNVV